MVFLLLLQNRPNWGTLKKNHPSWILFALRMHFDSFHLEPGTGRRVDREPSLPAWSLTKNGPWFASCCLQGERLKVEPMQILKAPPTTRPKDLQIGLQKPSQGYMSPNTCDLRI